MVPPVLFIGPAVALIIIMVYVVALRTQHHYMSELTCSRCGRTFEYKWVPLASFSPGRLGKSRYLQCPLCKEWSTFDLWNAGGMVQVAEGAAILTATAWSRNQSRQVELPCLRIGP